MAGFLLGATGAFLVSISLKALRIIALAQAAFLGFLAVSGIISINFGRLLEILTYIVNWFADSLDSIFSSKVKIVLSKGSLLSAKLKNGISKKSTKTAKD